MTMDNHGIKSRVGIHIVFEMPEDITNWLKTLVQNPIYEDEKPTEAKHRDHIFKAIVACEFVRPLTANPSRTPARCVFRLRESTAKWLRGLVCQPIYEDEDEEESRFRRAIDGSFFTIDLSDVEKAKLEWDLIPF